VIFHRFSPLVTGRSGAETSYTFASRFISTLSTPALRALSSELPQTTFTSELRFSVIESGDAAVSVAGKERANLGPGDHFGEIALIDEGVRSATITATSDLVCYGLTFWEFKPLVVANGEIGWKLLHYLAQKLRSAELE